MSKSLPAFFLGSIAYTSIIFVLGAIISRSYGAINFAEFSLVISIISPIFLLFGGGLRLASASDIACCFSKLQYINLRLILSMLAILFSFAASVFFDLNYFLITCIIAYKLAESFFDLINGLLQRQKDQIFLSKIMFFSSILALVGSYVISLRSSLEVVMLYSGVVLLLGTILGFYRVSASFSNGSSIQLFKKVILIGSTVMLASLFMNMPRIYLGYSSDLNILAGFSAVLNIVLISSVICSIVGQYFLPNLAVSKFNEYLLYSFSLLIGCFFVLSSFWHDEILYIIYGAEISVTFELYFNMMLFVCVQSINTSLNYVFISKGLISENTKITFLGVMIMIALFTISSTIKFSVDQSIVISYIMFITSMLVSLTMAFKRIKHETS